ncbi:MAG: hypothetical protein GY847_17975 [Proteobacteria bacterium]|nr:hypothetical protein [Pseudomonadota bacterium]
MTTPPKTDQSSSRRSWRDLRSSQFNRPDLICDLPVSMLAVVVFSTILQITFRFMIKQTSDAFVPWHLSTQFGISLVTLMKIVNVLLIVYVVLDIACRLQQARRGLAWLIIYSLATAYILIIFQVIYYQVDRQIDLWKDHCQAFKKVHSEEINLLYYHDVEGNYWSECTYDYHPYFDRAFAEISISQKFLELYKDDFDIRLENGLIREQDLDGEVIPALLPILPASFNRVKMEYAWNKPPSSSFGMIIAANGQTPFKTVYQIIRSAQATGFYNASVRLSVSYCETALFELPRFKNKELSAEPPPLLEILLTRKDKLIIHGPRIAIDGNSNFLGVSQERPAFEFSLDEQRKISQFVQELSKKNPGEQNIIVRLEDGVSLVTALRGICFARVTTRYKWKSRFTFGNAQPASYGQNEQLVSFEPDAGMVKDGH